MSPLRHPLPWLLAILCLTGLGAGESTESAKKSLRQFSAVFEEVAKTATPAVVYIQAEKDIKGLGGDQEFNDPFQPFNDEFFRRFFGERMPPGQRRRGMAPPRQPDAPPVQSSQGTGFVVSTDGYIMTNHHVAAEADRLTVKMSDGREFPAKLVGSDRQTDVAVIKIEASGLPVLKLGAAKDIQVGEWVMAIGNPFGLSQTVTAGIISAKGRSSVGIIEGGYEDFLQTDAAINPGNSGGPLVNLDAEVIGINTAIFSRSGGYMGIGFAIPIDLARNVYEQIRQKGSVARGFLGVGIQDLTQELAESFNLAKPDGVLITQVAPDSPAAKAGVKSGDVVLAFQGQTVANVGVFRNAVAMTAPGTKAEVEILRDGKKQKLELTIGDAGKSAWASGNDAVDGRSELGLRVAPIDEKARQEHHITAKTGVVITTVEADSQAARAGLREGMVVVAVDDTSITDVPTFRTAVAKAQEAGRKAVRLLIAEGDWHHFVLLRIQDLKRR